MPEIKGWFRSIWSASVGKLLPPTQSFGSDNLCKMVLSYRFGLGNSKNYMYDFNGLKIECPELFDVSFKQVRRGLEVNKQVVSVFKPLLAKWVFGRYGAGHSVVWDPCAGFGGRLLGFLSAFENGLYIACEPNMETCSELSTLAGTLGCGNRIRAHCVAMEDFDLSEGFADIVFTCPPYHLKETYCAHHNQAAIRYPTVSEWETGFVGTLMVKIHKALKKGGNVAIVFDQANIAPCVGAAEAVGLVPCGSQDISNTPTHLTRKNNKETILFFRKP